MDLCRRFQPIILLDKEERYFPIDFEKYIGQCSLVNCKTGETYIEDLTPELLGQWVSDNPKQNNMDMFLWLKDGINNPIVANYDTTFEQLKEVPLYVRVKEMSGETYITYAHMYAYNGTVGLFQSDNSKLRLTEFEHFSDLEHVTVKLVDGELESVFFSMHDGGYWIGKNEISFRGERPIVFSARETHASYPCPGTTCRFLGFVADNCSLGTEWDAKKLILMGDDLQQEKSWILFRGTLSKGHVANFPEKSWWNKEEKNGYISQILPKSWVDKLNAAFSPLYKSIVKTFFPSWSVRY